MHVHTITPFGVYAVYSKGIVSKGDSNGDEVVVARVVVASRIVTNMREGG